MLTAANRDPLVVPVARAEVQAALTALLERFDRIDLVAPLEQIPWTNSLTSRGPVRLPIRLAWSAHINAGAVRTF